MALGFSCPIEIRRDRGSPIPSRRSTSAKQCGPLRQVRRCTCVHTCAFQFPIYRNSHLALLFLCWPFASVVLRFLAAFAFIARFALFPLRRSTAATGLVSCLVQVRCKPERPRLQPTGVRHDVTATEHRRQGDKCIHESPVLSEIVDVVLAVAAPALLLSLASLGHDQLGHPGKDPQPQMQAQTNMSG